MATKRDRNGRFTAEHHKTRNLAIGGALAGLTALGVAAAAFFRNEISAKFGDDEHTAPELALDLPRPGADARAPAAFRPDMDAPMTAAEREALRPPGGKPTITASEGEIASA